MLQVVCWKASTGRLCEWSTCDEQEAREVGLALGAAGMPVSVEEMPEPGELLTEDEPEQWTAEDILRNAG